MDKNRHTFWRSNFYIPQDNLAVHSDTTSRIINDMHIFVILDLRIVC
jgi:hypothetical protein